MIYFQTGFLLLLYTTCLVTSPTTAPTTVIPSTTNPASITTTAPSPASNCGNGFEYGNKCYYYDSSALLNGYQEVNNKCQNEYQGRVASPKTLQLIELLIANLAINTEVHVGAESPTVHTTDYTWRDTGKFH